MGSLTRRDLNDAADACEVYADRLTERVERHYEALEESKGDDIQQIADRFRRLTEKLRRPAAHADARSETAGEFGDPPRPGESKKQFAERVLDEAQEAPSWDAYVYSLACGLYDAEKRTYPEPSMESDGTGLSDRHEDEGRG